MELLLPDIITRHVCLASPSQITHLETVDALFARSLNLAEMLPQGIQSAK